MFDGRNAAQQALISGAADPDPPNVRRSMVCPRSGSATCTWTKPVVRV